MQEKYQPSQEEMNKAKDTMTDLQSNLSDRLSVQSEKLEELGVSGQLEYREEDLFDEYKTNQTGKKEFISGNLNGHRLELRYFTYYNGYRSQIYGDIDELPMSQKDAEQVFYKYREIAKLLTPEMSEKAQEEIIEFDKRFEEHARDKEVREKQQAKEQQSREKLKGIL